MADLKPLVPKWVRGTSTSSFLKVGTVVVGCTERFLGWRGIHDGVTQAFFQTEAEARAWVEAQLYGEVPRGY